MPRHEVAAREMAILPRLLRATIGNRGGRPSSIVLQHDLTLGTDAPNATARKTPSLFRASNVTARSHKYPRERSLSAKAALLIIKDLGLRVLRTRDAQSTLPYVHLDSFSRGSSLRNSWYVFGRA